MPPINNPNSDKIWEDAERQIRETASATKVGKSLGSTTVSVKSSKPKPESESTTAAAGAAKRKDVDGGNRGDKGQDRKKQKKKKSGTDRREHKGSR
jgi:hypothetical protein